MASFSRLIPGNWLNDECVNVFMSLLNIYCLTRINHVQHQSNKDKDLTEIVVIPSNVQLHFKVIHNDDKRKWYCDDLKGKLTVILDNYEKNEKFLSHLLILVCL